jgi:hypothetical protein
MYSPHNCAKVGMTVQKSSQPAMYGIVMETSQKQGHVLILWQQEDGVHDQVEERISDLMSVEGIPFISPSTTTQQQQIQQQIPQQTSVGSPRGETYTKERVQELAEIVKATRPDHPQIEDFLDSVSRCPNVPHLLNDVGEKLTMLLSGDQEILSRKMDSFFEPNGIYAPSSPCRDDLPIMSMSGKKADSYEDLIYVVCDASSVGGRRATPLLDVYDSLAWRAAVTNANCSSELFLVESTYDEFLCLPNAEVLSYRWSEVITVKCGVREPGSGELSEPRESEISLDIFRKLMDLRESYLWVDYLSHLNDPSHKRAVMRRMGSLYLYGNVFPLYLQDFSTSTSRFEFYCDLFSDKKKLADVHAQLHELQSLVKDCESKSIPVKHTRTRVDEMIRIIVEQIENMRKENPSEIAYLVSSVVESLQNSDYGHSLLYIMKFLENSFSKKQDLHDLFVDAISMLPESKASLSLRRGWIQQEISFGRLPVDIVKSFIKECIRRSKFELLGTFIRRRHKAIGVIEDSSQDSIERKLVTFSPMQVRENNMSGELAITNAFHHICGHDGYKVKSQDELHFEDLSTPQGASPGFPAANDPCFNFADLNDQETGGRYWSLSQQMGMIMNPSIFQGSPQMSVTQSSAIAKNLRNKILSLEGIELELFIDKLTSSSSEPNTFDPTSFFSAYQLLRSFAESRLTYENDAYFAMVECAAISYGIPIHHFTAANDENISDSFSEIFKMCWNTLLSTHCTVSGNIFSFSMSRTQPQEWALGLRVLSPLLAAAAYQQKQNFVVKISNCPFEDTKNTYLIFEFKAKSVSKVLIFKEKDVSKQEHEREADFVVLYEDFNAIFND